MNVRSHLFVALGVIQTNHAASRIGNVSRGRADGQGIIMASTDANHPFQLYLCG